MNALGYLLFVLIILFLVFCIKMPIYNLPEKLQQDYPGHIVIGKGTFLGQEYMALATDSSTALYINPSGLVLQTFAIGDTIK